MSDVFIYRNQLGQYSIAVTCEHGPRRGMIYCEDTEEEALERLAWLDGEGYDVPETLD